MAEKQTKTSRAPQAEAAPSLPVVDGDNRSVGTVTLSASVTDGDSTTTGTVVIRVHNSLKEVGDIARKFLVDFSEQALPPEQVVANFSDVCKGKSDELLDVRNNQRNFDITAYTVGQPAVGINFGGFCPYRFRFGDGCASELASIIAPIRDYFKEHPQSQKMLASFRTSIGR